MNKTERIRRRLEAAIDSSEERIAAGSCYTKKVNGRFAPEDYKTGVCPLIVLVLGKLVEGEYMNSHTQAEAILGVDEDWGCQFIQGMDNDDISVKTEAYELGQYFRIKYLERYI